MSKKVKCPNCGKKNELVNFNDFRYPFAKIPKEAQDEIKRLSEQNIDAGIMMCFNCQAFGVFPL